MWNRSALAVLLVAATAACGEEAPSDAPDVSAGGSASAGGSPLSGSGPTAGASVTTAGGPAAVDGGTGGIELGGGGMTVGGGGLGAAGVGGDGTGGGGSGGNAGTAGASAGAGGNGSLTSLASELDGLRLECPCIDAEHFGLDKPDNCDSTPAVDRQTHPKTLGGDPSVVYDVKLRVRGNTEPNTYVGGKLEQNRFYIGGQTSAPGYTAYMLTVTEPKESYFFNYSPTTGHFHFLIDYEVVIPMRGGTTVTFEVNGGRSVPDGHGVSNRESLVVPDIAPAPAPFNGQLVQFDVVSVQPRVL